MNTQKTKLGRPEQVGLCEAWTSEGGDLMPWLAKAEDYEAPDEE